ncbi:MAG: hypothetical protein Q9173_001032 [Seirophora scorigena]
MALNVSDAYPTFFHAPPNPKTPERANKQPSPPSKPTSSKKIATSPRRIKPNPPPIPDISEPLPYHVHRTPSQQLPVYQLAKRGGNLLLTRLRKVDGDIMQLKLHLQQALDLRPEEISINQLTRHIHIKSGLDNYRVGEGMK